MMFKKKWRWVAIVIVTCFIVVFCVGLLTPELPTNDLSRARDFLSKAEKSLSPQYAPNQYNKAMHYYDSAMMHWKEENLKMSPFRDYSRSKYYADKASIWAQASMDEAHRSAGKLSKKVMLQMTQIKAKIDFFERVYKCVPLSKNQIKDLSQATLWYHEASIALQNKNISSMENTLNASEKKIDALTHYASGILNNYFKDYPKWKQLTTEGIHTSKKQKTTCIVIDKYNRACQLYDRGVLIESYPIELGNNWIGDKQHAGDKTTPEGQYKVIEKKTNGQTKYHKALLLNYPNEDDQNRFKKNQVNGTIKGARTIGNLIEIHGHGGKGFDWTDGCIALSNSDMDKLFLNIDMHTPVIIVGSLTSLENILK
ncbi:MAG: tetratricopeptide (TPR) repeat protein [Cyclobacteriaceae bacterium]|jgi:tetratricopeptide (TPR) repeat protein